MTWQMKCELRQEEEGEEDEPPHHPSLPSSSPWAAAAVSHPPSPHCTDLDGLEVQEKELAHAGRQTFLNDSKVTFHRCSAVGNKTQ